MQLAERSVGEVVAEDYARAAVFKRFGIDFCCGGNRSVGDACAAVGVEVADLESELGRGVAESRGGGGPFEDPRSWELDFLASYIAQVHHAYVRETLPVLVEFSTKIARVHGASRPELHEILALVKELAKELERHTDEEEEVLFPRIAALVAERKAAETGGTTGVTRVQDSIGHLEHDHDHAGELLRRIRRLSDDFTPPEMACSTYRATYAKLEEFEEDLHRHVHLENNILFPRAALLEEELAARVVHA